MTKVKAYKCNRCLKVFFVDEDESVDFLFLKDLGELHLCPDCANLMEDVYVYRDDFNKLHEKWLDKKFGEEE